MKTLFLAIFLCLAGLSARAQAQYESLLLLNNSASQSILPLELNPTPAAAAISVARLLTNSWTGALGLMIRQSDGATNYLLGTPTGNNLTTFSAWYAGENVILTNGFDQTGHGRHFVNGDTNQCFFLVTNGVPVTQNGKSVLRRVSTSSFLQAPSVALSLPVSAVTVTYSVGRTVSDVIFSGGSTTRTALKYASLTYRLNSGVNLDTQTLTVGQWDILRFKFVTGDDSIGLDGGALATGTAGDNATLSLNIGAPAICADMMIGELVLWNEDTSDAVLQAVSDNMNAFYAAYP